MRFRTGLAGLAAAASMLAAAAPASAERQIITVAKGQSLGGGSTTDTVNMAFECAAEATDPANMEITQCYLEGLDDGLRYGELVGGSDSSPGGIGLPARLGTGLDVPAQPYRVCVQAQAFYLDLSWAESDLTCTAAGA